MAKKAQPKCRTFRPAPKTFSAFPEDVRCPVCNTNDDGPCVLVPIQDRETRPGSGVFASLPTHLACAVAKWYKGGNGGGILYTMPDPEWKEPG